jgi:dCMP deaminase
MLNKWDHRFIRLANEIATWSKDPSSQIGCVIVKDNKVLATGYNGFPKGILDDPERLSNREIKYGLIVHAEMNAIYNAAFHGVSLLDATMYVTGLPVCSDCAKGVISAGIKRVVMDADLSNETWATSWSKTEKMFRESKVEYNFV